METFDEYQKHLRYKYGSRAFSLLTFLNFLNYLLSRYTDFQWVESREMEFMLINFIAISYAITMYVYHGAYFKKYQKGMLYAFGFLVFGLINLFELISPYTETLSNGRLTDSAALNASQLIWLFGSLAYFARFFVDKRRDAKEDKME
ncbi:MAG: hypothetical protein JJU01_09960 [Alkalibacterium sp.]|nr:hypothetical protein [Alkalibacterium sp.]